MPNQAANRVEYPILAKPVVGNWLSALAGITFLFLCMILPLVGPAAVKGSGSPGAGPVAHLKWNYIAFTGVLVLALALAAAAVFSKLLRRTIDGSPLPFYSIALVIAVVAIGVAFALGLLSL